MVWDRQAQQGRFAINVRQSVFMQPFRQQIQIWKNSSTFSVGAYNNHIQGKILIPNVLLHQILNE